MLRGGCNYRYGFQGQETDDEVAGEGNSYTAQYWQYDSRLGRRWNIDPVVKVHESPYATFANNPIWFSDPNGADSIKAPDNKNHWIDGTLKGYDGNLLVQATEGSSTHYYYWNDKKNEYYQDDHNGRNMWHVWHTADALEAPLTFLDLSYYILSPVLQYAWEAHRMSTRTALYAAINYDDPSWIDLSQMYIWELGDDNLVVSGNDKQTIKDLKSHSGVNSARWDAMKGWKKGGNKKSSYTSTWAYDLVTFEKNVTTDWVWLEVFLGSYDTKVTMVKASNVYSFTFRVYNKSSVESLSRFKRKNGEDMGILKNRKRGTGYGIGGDFTQTFKWTERYTLQNGKFTPYNP